jgi:hypothetical protein
VVTDDLAVSRSDFDTFSITVPQDSRLPDGGGYTVSGLYNLTQAAFGRPTNNYITFADNYGDISRQWEGFDVTFNARLQRDLTIQGGTSTGRFMSNNCDIVDSIPEAFLSEPGQFCDRTNNFNTQFKMIASYLVPRVDVQLGVTVQNIPGPEVLANYTATNAVVSPSLGRPLSGGAANVVLGIIEPGTMYGERMNQIDVRVGKIFRVRNLRLTPSVDIYNLLNANPVLTENQAYASFRRPQNILAPRFLELVMKVDF